MSSVHLAPESEHSALIFKSNRDADGHNDGHNTMVHTSTTYLEPHRLTTQLHRHPSLIILCESFFFFFLTLRGAQAPCVPSLSRSRPGHGDGDKGVIAKDVTELQHNIKHKVSISETLGDNPSEVVRERHHHP
jgi:hypothetical protein